MRSQNSDLNDFMIHDYRQFQKVLQSTFLAEIINMLFLYMKMYDLAFKAGKA